MKGYLLTYASSTRKDITKINYFLFGRIAHIKRGNKKERYYYPGFFETTPYKKLANGCYFVQDVNDDFNGLLNIYPVDIKFDNDEMLNGKDYWDGKIDAQVKNWK